MDNFRRSLLINSGGGGTDPSQAAPLEVAFYNGSKIVIRKQEKWIDGETPIGIVVVPGYHNRYGDGTCGIMSLVGMDYSHPQIGIQVSNSGQTDNVSMYWGSYGTSIGNSIFVSITALTSSYNYIPYQSASGSTACTVNSGGLVWPYAGTTTAPTSGASTTYSNTGGYVQATTGKSGCDFNGIRNTAALYVETHTATQWMTTYPVKNDTGKTNTPAAACAGRFKTVGTKSFLDVYTGITSNSTNYGTSASTKENTGFWYLPAEGELCYLPSKRFEINKTILALNQKYGNVGVQLNTDGGYWSSSECSSNAAWSVDIRDGYVYLYYKNGSGYVRAFMRL
jgi:hypothetical protein